MVCDVLRDAAVRNGWKVASYGTELPPSIVKAEFLVNLHNTRPDIVLYNDFAQCTVTVVLLEVTVTFDNDRNITSARQQKSAVYKPLMEAIKLSHPLKTVTVATAPAVVGARGIIHDMWFNDLKPLGLAEGEAADVGRKASIAAVRGSHWIWTLWAAQAHGNPNNEPR